MAVHALSMARADAHLLQSRQLIEDEIERLIALLDLMDGDADAERDDFEEPQGDDEPWLGWIASGDGAIICASDSDLEFDESDFEPDDHGEEDHRHFPTELRQDCPAGVMLALSGCLA